MKRLVADEGLAHVVGGGAGAYHVGERADKRSRQAARSRGIALESRGRQFEDTDFARFDFVLAMDEENLANLSDLPSAKAYEGQLRLARDFDPASPARAEVPDPYYGGDGGFEHVLDLCEAACRGLIDHLRDSGRLD